VKVGIIHMQEPLTKEFCENFLAQNYTHIAIDQSVRPEAPKDWKPMESASSFWKHFRRAKKRK